MGFFLIITAGTQSAAMAQGRSYSEVFGEPGRVRSDYDAEYRSSRVRVEEEHTNVNQHHVWTEVRIGGRWGGSGITLGDEWIFGGETRTRVYRDDDWEGTRGYENFGFRRRGFRRY
jgi:hypothetical protein